MRCLVQEIGYKSVVETVLRNLQCSSSEIQTLTCSSPQIYLLPRTAIRLSPVDKASPLECHKCEYPQLEERTE